MLDLLERRDDALVKVFFNVLELNDQKHIVDYILDPRNTTNENGVSQQQCRGQRCLDQDAAVAGCQFNPCIDEIGCVSVIEGQTFVCSAYNSDGNFAAHQASLDSDVLMDCLPAEDSSTFASETACKVVEMPLASGQGLEGEQIELREYQKELSRPGIEGHNQIICAPTGSGKTYTAGYICQQQRLWAEKEGRHFKAIFIVCIRNLITQQSDALGHIIGKDVVRGADDKLSLSIYSECFDVVVATAQVKWLYRVVIFTYRFYQILLYLLQSLMLYLFGSKLGFCRILEIQGGPQKAHKVYSTVTLQSRVLESCNLHQNLQNLLGSKETK